MRAKLQGTVVAIFEESCAINTQQCFRLLNGHPLTLFGHDLEGSRVRIYLIRALLAVKGCSQFFYLYI